ncbi:MAG TPA: class I SAM-dependent methyltransferase [Chitinophagaceae bacterium]|jgi:2-polyprenyl-3-methyl-5-hydroxy-6-metoxy-1,4-benzoquinol methylase|nr:class I SAM-dependent methyltransferase [Chitinophagaceae bacterium]
MTDKQDYFQANKELWNQRTTVHLDSAFYNLEGFKKGETVLTPIELSELGVVKGKNLLHLQCHFGMDSLDWARRGASVTGVDLSDKAISEAQKLNSEMGLDASFVCCNVLDTSAHVPGQFDIVFTSYGTIGWLPDLQPWAKMIAEKLKPGGIFYIAEFHPVVWMFDDDFTRIAYSYENQEVIITENQGTYTDRSADIKGKEYSWNHSISEVLNALIGAGLQIKQFNEHMYSPYPCFRNVVEFEPGKWHIKGMEGKIPMVYSLMAKSGK